LLIQRPVKEHTESVMPTSPKDPEGQ
jgi:hypothetical protein